MQYEKGSQIAGPGVNVCFMLVFLMNMSVCFNFGSRANINKIIYPVSSVRVYIFIVLYAAFSKIYLILSQNP